MQLHGLVEAVRIGPQQVPQERREMDFVADPAAVEDQHLLGAAHHAAAQQRDHARTSGTPRRESATNASASASPTWLTGSRSRVNNARTIRWIWRLSARPEVTRARFTAAGGMVSTGIRRSDAATLITPQTWPMRMPVRGKAGCAKTSSSAIAPGRHSARTSQSPV